MPLIFSFSLVFLIFLQSLSITIYIVYSTTKETGLSLVNVLGQILLTTDMWSIGLSNEVLLQYISVKVLEGTHVEARQGFFSNWGCSVDVSITV